MNMKDSEDVDAELDAFDEHQKERREEEVVQQHSYYCTQLLQLNTCYIGLSDELHKCCIVMCFVMRPSCKPHYALHPVCLSVCLSHANH